MDRDKALSKKRWLIAGDKWDVRSEMTRYGNKNWPSIVKDSEAHAKSHEKPIAWEEDAM
ncbi:MAG: hypothetical protein V3U49_08435 [Nitrososphaerales archaeon]